MADLSLRLTIAGFILITMFFIGGFLALSTAAVVDARKGHNTSAADSAMYAFWYLVLSLFDGALVLWLWERL